MEAGDVNFYASRYDGKCALIVWEILPRNVCCYVTMRDDGAKIAGCAEVCILWGAEEGNGQKLGLSCYNLCGMCAQQVVVVCQLIIVIKS